ncbi:MAG: hypothetical protein KJN93_03460, partial [Alphaproteobacteria bacterium]|nr:hypothetical protein [Alphaproteobacteria bacterium]
MVQHLGHRRTAPEPGVPQVGLAEKVQALRDPSIYPVPCDTVETIETHMSWVFLAGDTVYK